MCAGGLGRVGVVRDVLAPPTPQRLHNRPHVRPLHVQRAASLGSPDELVAGRPLGRPCIPRGLVAVTLAALHSGALCVHEAETAGVALGRLLDALTSAGKVSSHACKGLHVPTPQRSCDGEQRDEEAADSGERACHCGGSCGT